MVVELDVIGRVRLQLVDIILSLEGEKKRNTKEARQDRNPCVKLVSYAILPSCRVAVYRISSIGRSQRQIMHQLDNLNNLLRGSLGEKSHPTRTNSRKSIDMSSDSVGARVMVVAAVGCLGIFLMKVLLNKK
ncbi:hypothetical protein D0Y65_003750 [Glycine soja]|uniref:Uncharacterized protein n=1 Tax=Glycine soja TaxID=3848 RepID=A0A445LND5_GLYSO|nr:hypothetical protein D0Y65_003750 [Glycine soja]